MHQLRIFIVDDEPVAIRRLQNLLRECEGVTVAGTASNAEQALVEISSDPPDLVLLDIEMPGSSGISLAARLRLLPLPPAVIFVTAFSRFALEAFNVAASHYLLKPVEIARLRQAIDQVRRERAALGSMARIEELEELVVKLRGAELERSPPDPGRLWLASRTGQERVDVRDILSISSERDYVHVRTAAKTYFVRARLGDLEARLGAHGMLRIHRSAMVRASAVRRIERAGDRGHRLILEDGTSVRCSRRFGAAVQSLRAAVP